MFLFDPATTTKLNQTNDTFDSCGIIKNLRDRSRTPSIIPLIETETGSAQYLAYLNRLLVVDSKLDSDCSTITLQQSPHSSA